MSDNKYTLEEMMAAIKKGLDGSKKEYPDNVAELIKERDELKKEVELWKTNHNNASEWNRTLNRQIANLKAENNKMALDLADIRKVLDGA